MMQTIEVEIDSEGRIRPLEPGVQLQEGKGLLTLIPASAGEPALLSENALAEDWLQPEEEEAWAHLQPDK